MPIDIKKETAGPNRRIKKVEKEPDNFLFLQGLRIGLIVLTVVIFLLVTVTYGIYFGGWQNSLVESVSTVVPFPIASVNGDKMIYLDEYNRNNKAIRRFLESQEASSGNQEFDFANEEGLKRLAVVKKSIFNELIESKIVQILAEEKGIKFSLEQARATAEKIINRDDRKAENLKSINLLYGWRSDDFAERVVLPLLYREKLEEIIKEKGYLDLETKNEVSAIKKKLEGGEDFSKLAEEFSDSPSKSSGGLLPSFSFEEMPFPELKPVFDWSVGKIGDPFENEEGWHFIKLEKKIEEGRSKRIEIRHILLTKRPFSDWLDEQKKEFKVRIMLPEYYWHQKMGKLYFKEDDLNEFEVKFNRAYYEEKAEELDLLRRAEKINN